MKRHRIYIAGKITGDDDFRVKFLAAELRLMRLGWEYGCIANPVRYVPQQWPWWLCMVRCLRLLAGCSHVAMLPDWNLSRGARIEHRWARLLRKEILYIDYRPIDTDDNDVWDTLHRYAGLDGWAGQQLNKN